jgi:hypothetical protein
MWIDFRLTSDFSIGGVIISCLDTWKKKTKQKCYTWNSKMVARERKHLGEMLETHLAGKTTKKRQNFEPSITPACTEHLHFTLNGETRRAPGPPDARAQMAWEDMDKVS